jgi:hypothetical protein
MERVVMNQLDRVQRISGYLRYMVLLSAVVLGCAVVITLFVPGQDWVILGDGLLNNLFSSGTIGMQLMLVLLTPILIILALGMYWLQRLFSEYQQGKFFTDGSMRCYLWLVWLKAAAFVYGMFWPMALSNLASTGGLPDLSVTIEAGTLVELLVLIVIVHVLKEAQEIHDENKAFV